MSTCMVYDRATTPAGHRRGPPDQAGLAVRRLEAGRRGADAVLPPRLRPADDGRPPVQHVRPVPALGRRGRRRRDLHPALAGSASRCGSTATGPRRATCCTSTDCARFVVRRAAVRRGRRADPQRGHRASTCRVNALAAAIEPDPARIVHVEHIHPQSEIAVLRCDPRRAAELLGWRPAVGLDEGLGLVRAWMAERTGRSGSSASDDAPRPRPRLAIDGGEPVRATLLPYARQSIDDTRRRGGRGGPALRLADDRARASRHSRRRSPARPVPATPSRSAPGRPRSTGRPPRPVSGRATRRSRRR